VIAVERGRTRVATAHGIDLWVAPREAPVASDAALLVMLRPERVRLGVSGGTNCFPATVTEVTYLGGLTAYRLEVGKGEVFAHVQNTGAGSYAVGEALTVGWNENDCVSLAAQ
jgi:ABC-type Fe3+/spermidine/putrescine transport system ATPase subunit